MELDESSALTWSSHDVGAWMMQTFSLPQETSDLCLDNEFDGETLLKLTTDEVLKHLLNIKAYKVRYAIMERIKALQVSAHLIESVSEPTESPTLDMVMAQMRKLEAQFAQSYSGGPSSRVTGEQEARARPLQVLSDTIIKGEADNGDDEEMDSPSFRPLKRPIRVVREAGQIRLFVDESSDEDSGEEANISDTLPKNLTTTTAPSKDRHVGRSTIDSDGDISLGSVDESNDDDEHDTDENEDFDTAEEDSDLDERLMSENVPAEKARVSRRTPPGATEKVSTGSRLNTDKIHSTADVLPAMSSLNVGGAASSEDHGHNQVIEDRVTVKSKHTKVLSNAIPKRSASAISTKGKSAVRVNEVNHSPLYLPQDGQSLTSLFFDSEDKAKKSQRKQPSTESSSSSDEWVVYAGNHQKHGRHLLGKAEIVQRNMRRVLRDPPIFRVPGGRTIYAPVRRIHDQDSVVKVYADGVKEPWRMSTWNEEMRSTQTLGPVTNASRVVFVPDQDMANFSFAPGPSKIAAVTTTTRVNAWSSTAAEDDFEYPLYGDSGTDDYSDDALLQEEIEAEEKESLLRIKKASKAALDITKARIPKQTVVNTIKAFMVEQEAKWISDKQPKMEKRSFKIYQQKDEFQNDILAELNDIKLRRLSDLVQALQACTYTSVQQLRKSCTALERTLDLRCELSWKLALFDGPPPPVPEPKTRAKPGAKSVRSPTDSVQAASSSLSSEAKTIKSSKGDAVSDGGAGDEADDDDEDSGRDDDDDDDDHDDTSDFIDDSEMSPPPSGPSSSTPRSKSLTSGAPSRRKEIRRTKVSNTSDSRMAIDEVEQAGDNASAPVNNDSGKDVDETADDGVGFPQLEENSGDVDIGIGSTLFNDSASTSTSMVVAPSMPIVVKASLGEVETGLERVVGEEGDDKTAVKLDSEDEEQGTIRKPRKHVSGNKYPISSESDNQATLGEAQRQEASGFDSLDDSSMEEPDMSTFVETLLHRQDVDLPKDAIMSKEDLRKFRHAVMTFDHNGPSIGRGTAGYNQSLEYRHWVELVPPLSSTTYDDFLAWKESDNTLATQGAISDAARIRDEEEARQSRKARWAAQKQKVVTAIEERRARNMEADRMENEKMEKRARNREPNLYSNEPIVISDSDSETSAMERRVSPVAKNTDVENDAQEQLDCGVVGVKRPANRDTTTTSPRPNKGKGRADRHNPSSDVDSSDEFSDRMTKKPRRSGDVAGDDGPLEKDDSLDMTEDDFLAVLEKRSKSKSKFGSKGRKARPMHDLSPAVLQIHKDRERFDAETRLRIERQANQARKFAGLAGASKDRVIINVGHADDVADVFIPEFLVKHLKPHQVDGVQFMWRNIVMYSSGCILAHAMGLGKTFQVVAFVFVLLNEIQAGNLDIPKELHDGRVLMLLPPTLLDNWSNEFEKWIPEDRRSQINVFTCHKEKALANRFKVLQEWHRSGGVLLLGYQMFRELLTSNRIDPRDGEMIEQFLLDPGPSIVFCDEGHELKNHAAKLTLSAKRIKTSSRVILTGYPLQNNLQEYWSMVDFMQPGYLDDLNSFKSAYVIPIEIGAYPDSTPSERRFAQVRMNVLIELLKSSVLRKDQSVLRATLPKKIDYVVSCKLTDLQLQVYKEFMSEVRRKAGNGDIASLLAAAHVSTTICNHPAAYKLGAYATRLHRTQAIANLQEQYPGVAFSDVTPAGLMPQQIMSAAGSVQADGEVEDDDSTAADEELLNLAEASSQTLEDVHDLENVRYSHKAGILLTIVKASKEHGEKVLVFSKSIPTLDYLQKMLNREIPHLGLYRLDGTTPMFLRQEMVNRFNTRTDTHVFLISTSSGAQGVNLVGANRVVLFDIGWNPSHVEQAIARTFRYGQTRQVYVYRLQTYQTMEDKLFKKNLHKFALSNRVVDNRNIHKNYNKVATKEYFADPPDEPPLWISDTRVEHFMKDPDVDDYAIRSVIENHKDSVTLISLQSNFVKEVSEDLTEADKMDIQRMIMEESTRINLKGTKRPGMDIGELTPTMMTGPLVTTGVLQAATMDVRPSMPSPSAPSSSSSISGPMFTGGKNVVGNSLVTAGVPQAAATSAQLYLAPSLSSSSPSSTSPSSSSSLSIPGLVFTARATMVGDSNSLANSLPPRLSTVQGDSQPIPSGQLTQLTYPSHVVPSTSAHAQDVQQQHSANLDSTSTMARLNLKHYVSPSSLSPHVSAMLASPTFQRVASLGSAASSTLVPGSLMPQMRRNLPSTLSFSLSSGQQQQHQHHVGADILDLEGPEVVQALAPTTATPRSPIQQGNPRRSAGDSPVSRLLATLSSSHSSGSKTSLGNRSNYSSPKDNAAAARNLIQAASARPTLNVGATVMRAGSGNTSVSEIGAEGSTRNETK